MIWFVFICAYYALSYSTVPVTGQCTVSSCAVSVSGSEECLQISLEEHDHKLETINQSMCSAFEKIEAAVNRTNARGQEELRQDLKTLFCNTSANFERVCVQSVNESLSSAIEIVRGSIDEKLQTMNETLSSAIDKINEKLNAILDRVNENSQSIEFHDYCRNTSDLCDCSDIKANGYRRSGVYRIYVVDQGQRYYASASCDMTTTNGPWTVFQRRKDGSVDFYREWNEYENGFGKPNGEFWLGNNFLHLLTSKRRYRLRVDLEDFEGGKRYAEYSTFTINSLEDKYRLRIGNYSGNAGDGLSWHNGQRFSTKDNDNDALSGNCAVTYRGAWWYKICYMCNLNGLYLRGRNSGREGIEWPGFRGQRYSLKTTEMKISSEA